MSAAAELLEEILALGASPVASLDGRVRFAAPRGAIGEALKARIKSERVALHHAAADKFGVELPTLAASGDPARASDADVAPELARLESGPLARWLAGVPREGKDFRLTKGPLQVPGKMVSAGAVWVIVGDVTVDGPLLTLSDRQPNWLIVDGDLRCKNLAVVEDSNLVVTGSVTAEELALCATRDSSAGIAGALSAPVVVSGLSAGSFALGGPLTVSTLYGHVGSLAGELASEPHERAAALAPEWLDDGKPRVDDTLYQLALENSLLAGGA